MRPSRLLALALLVSLHAAPAQACTLCHTPTAREVRHHVLEHDFAGNLMALALPLPLLLAAVWLAGRERHPSARPDAGNG
jgi:hypothetical protein